MATLNDNYERFLGRVLENIKLLEEDGISLERLSGIMGKTPHGIKSAVGILINRGLVTKHPTLNHYYFNEPSKFSSVRRFFDGMKKKFGL
jgi:hypothetical protein